MFLTSSLLEFWYLIQCPLRLGFCLTHDFIGHVDVRLRNLTADHDTRIRTLVIVNRLIAITSVTHLPRHVEHQSLKVPLVDLVEEADFCQVVDFILRHSESSLENRVLVNVLRKSISAAADLFRNDSE